MDINKRRITNNSWNKRNLEKMKEAVARYKAKNPLIVIAHNKARYIEMGKECEICESIENLEKHHEDYNKPSKIKTICHKCHVEIHYG